MKDGGMGSLKFHPSRTGRTMSAVAAEYRFCDSDGIPVSVELLLDQNGEMFELDVWKVDFTETVALKDDDAT